MIVKAREARPVRKKDGSWEVVMIEHEEEIPDKGRDTIICNKCSLDQYPECKKWCKVYAQGNKEN